MNGTREQEIIDNLKKIVNDEKTDHYFELISKYNELYENTELIGGKWVKENTDIELEH